MVISASGHQAFDSISLIVEPKSIDLSHSNLISRVLLQISRGVFLVSPLLLKLRVVHMKKIFNFDFLKTGSNDFH